MDGGERADADSQLDSEIEEESPDRYEGPIAEPWDGKPAINVFGASRQFLDFPTLVSDRNGGIIIHGGCIECYNPPEETDDENPTQRIDPSGEKLWGENGVFHSVSLIFPLDDASSYVSGGYTDESGLHFPIIGLMTPEGYIDYDAAFTYSEADISNIDIAIRFVTHDELFFASLEESTFTEGDWCFLGLDRNLDSWTGGIRCLFPKSQCEGYNCIFDECGSVHVLPLDVVEDPDGNFVFLFQKSVTDEQIPLLEPGEIYMQKYDRDLNQLMDPGCYGTLVGAYDYLCDIPGIWGPGWPVFSFGSDIYCWDRITQDQLTPELIELLGSGEYESLDYLLRFTPEDGYAPSWTPYTADLLFPANIGTLRITNQDGARGGRDRSVYLIPDTMGGAYVFGIARNENDCGLTCPPEMLFIQHLDMEGRITLGETGAEFLRLAQTPSNDFGLMMHILAATDDAGNLFYAWENPINHLDTEWPVDQPIPWGWAYKVCVQKATPVEVNVWPDYPCVEVMRFQDVLFNMFNTPPISGLVPDGEGGVIVVFAGAEAKLYAQRVSAEGELMWDAREHPYP